ncbi:MAG: hypothetical protein HQ510_09415 [Candidatus Marinimicrobia bacterium]|nr:hypothetical protein [Candidatus Neomarinimicrobiota bacterium]
MKYPTALLVRGRCQFPKNKIRHFNYMYARQKPSTDWNENDGLPDFTRIKTNQSYNWCIFSIPIWTRFDDKKTYLSDYAVTAFSVETIRESYKYGLETQSQVLEVKHKPMDQNYSHCEMNPLGNLNKTQRREIRMSLRHKCYVSLRPNETQNKVGRIVALFKMYAMRIITLHIRFKNSN